MCLTSLSSKHNGHFLLSVFLVLVIPFNFPTPASNHAIPLLFLLEQHSMYDLFTPAEIHFSIQCQ
jgi:hypothetical protein